MPHLAIPPTTVEEILRTSELDTEWASVLRDLPLPAGTDFDLETIKYLSEATLPRTRHILDASRPEDVIESELFLDVPSTQLKPVTGRNRLLSIYPKLTNASSVASPIILIFHGGGHTIGSPESELPLARLLVQKYNAIVILPSYRLAPEHRFPSSINDGFQTLKRVALDISALSSGQTPQLLPPVLKSSLKVSSPLIIGGTSAGATIAASISHLYHAYATATSEINLPQITGILFSCGTVINSSNVPKSYLPYYRSLAQNASTLPLDSDLYSLFHNACRPNKSSPLWASLDQHPDQQRDNVGEDHVYLANTSTRVYFQACGADLTRDDTLIYERVLREEAGVETRLDLYSGFGHVFWGMSGAYAEMKMSKRRMQDTVDGIGWLLRK